jgi:hypothetical protein
MHPVVIVFLVAACDSSGHNGAPDSKRTDMLASNAVGPIYPEDNKECQPNAQIGTYLQGNAPQEAEKMPQDINSDKLAIDFPVDVTGTNLTTRGEARSGVLEVVCGDWKNTSRSNIVSVDCALKVGNDVADLTSFPVHSWLSRSYRNSKKSRIVGRNSWRIEVAAGSSDFFLNVGVDTCQSVIELRELLTPPTKGY